MSSFDWKLEEGTAEDALMFFLENLWYHLVTYIPRRKICFIKRTHPWLNDRCMAAIQKKNTAEGSEQYDSECAKCMQILGEEKSGYVDQLKEKIANLPKSSKAWWRLNRELLHRKVKLSSIPTLKEDKVWISDPKDKADAFARTFVSKSNLPDEVVDTPFFGVPDVEFGDLVVFRSRACRRLFKRLDETKATDTTRYQHTS